MFATSVFAYGDRLLVVTSWQTAMGLEAVDAPVHEVAAAAGDTEIGRVVRQALADTREGLAEGRGAREARQAPVLRHCGLASWGAFVPEAWHLEVWTRSGSIDDTTELQVVPSKRERGQLLSLPAGGAALVAVAEPAALGAGVREGFARCRPPLVLAEGAAPADEPAVPAGAVAPERRPVAFGPKALWLAVRGREVAEVAAALRLADAEPAGWETGVEAALGEELLVFVAPSVDGWTLAVGRALDLPPAEHAPRLAGLSRALGEVQLFGTHRAGDYAAWGRAVDGEVRRLLVFTGDVVAEGAPDEAERALGIDFETRFPDEGDVLAMAEAWSLDPTGLEARVPAPGAGLLGRLPAARA